MNGGCVFLVGAGPGDPELLTLKGLRLLRSADAVIHDRLIDRRLLSHVPDGAEVIDVGKILGRRGPTQEDISRLLVSRAQSGQRVVRLKGGDPFVFGRGGEESEALRQAGVRFEVVPGVTSAVAAPAYAGIPLTHRDYSSAFTVVTASWAADRPCGAVDWDLLARLPGTLVVLMGLRNLEEITSLLIDGGRPTETPTACVSWGTEPWQRTVTGTLGEIAASVRSAGLSAPAAIIVGEVVRLRQSLNWYETLPLFGKRVLVTRARNQAGTLSQRLTELGAYPVEVPTIEIRPLADYTAFDDRMSSMSSYDWVIFTSSNAVQAVSERLQKHGRDSRALHGVRVACIGEATRTALARIGLRADLTAAYATSRGLVHAFDTTDLTGMSVLLPRTDIAKSELPERLRSAGACVDQVQAYRTAAPEDARQAALDALHRGVDSITFTSSSTVDNLVGLLGDEVELLRGPAIACIGPVTATTASRYGLNVDIVAQVHTVEGLVADMVEHFGTHIQGG